MAQVEHYEVYPGMSYHELQHIVAAVHDASRSAFYAASTTNSRGFAHKERKISDELKQLSDRLNKILRTESTTNGAVS